MDAPAAVGGSTVDMASADSLIAAATSHSDKYNTEQFAYWPRDCSMRTQTDNTSSSNNSRSSSTSSSDIDRQQNICHNHTYPLTPSQRSRSERDDKARRDSDEHATRSRDEKKAKDMQVDCLATVSLSYR